MKIFRHHKTKIWDEIISKKKLKKIFASQTTALCVEMTEKLSLHNQQGQKVSSGELFAALYASGPQTDQWALTG